MKFLFYLLAAFITAGVISECVYALTHSLTIKVLSCFVVGFFFPFPESK